jgi:hypothetical protein
MLVRPHLATVLVVLLLYLNVPVLLNRQVGVPKVLAAAVVLLLAFPLGREIIVRRAGFRVDATLRLMLLYLTFLLAGAAIARSTEIALEYVFTYVTEGILLYVLVVNVLRNLADVRRVVAAMLTAGALLGALTTYQEITGTFRQQFGGLAQRNAEFLELRELAEKHPELREQLRNYGNDGRSRRAGGPVSEPNRFAQILVVLLPLVAWRLRHAGSVASRTMMAAAGVLVLAGVVFTDSRGGFITVMLLAWGALRVGWLRLPHLAIGAIVVVIAVPIVAPRYVGRVASLWAAPALAGARTGGAEPDGAMRGRATEMLAAGQVFLDHPIVGVGPGQYMPMYSAEYHQRAGVKFRQLAGQRRAHSLYLELAAESGMVGLVLFGLIVGSLLRGLRHAGAAVSPADRERADLAHACRLSLLAYLFTAIFLHLSYVRYFWLLVALASASLHLAAARTAAPSPAGAIPGWIRAHVRPASA